MHTGATELDHFAAKWFVRRKIEFPLAVIAEICRRQLARLQPIRADNFARGEFFDDKVIAELIEWIDIEPSRVRLGQSFAQFEVENLKPQLLGAPHFFCALRQPRRVPRTRWRRIRDRSVCFGQYVQLCSPGVSPRALSIQFDDWRRSHGRFRRGNTRKTARDRASADHPRTSPYRHDMGARLSR